MSTFLQLCQSLAKEAGVSSTGPTTSVSQSGEMLRMVNWIQTAYEELQGNHPNWDFLRNDLSFNLIAGTATYTPTAAGLSELMTWKTDSLRAYLTATGVNDELCLTYMPWDVFRDVRLIGANRTASGRPMEFTVQPNNSITFWPNPSAVYTVVGEYWKRPQTMSLDADEPLMPRQFHMILVWQALMYFAPYEADPTTYANGERQYKKLISKLELDQLPELSMSGALA